MIFPSHESIFYSADSIETEPGVFSQSEHIPTEYLRSIDASGLPPGELHLKPGCPLILLRNLAPARGLCNGTRLILKRATARVLEVQILGGQHDGELSALTINKAQGQSVRYVGIDLREPVFAHGQLYVALSRATSHKHVKIVLPSTTSANQLRNVVYPEIFSMVGEF